MDGKRFDDLTEAFATGASRRRVLKLLGGGLAGGLGLALGGRTATRAEDGGNSACAHLCQELFPPGKERGQCIAAGAHGEGPCFEVGCVTNTVTVFLVDPTWIAAGSYPVGDTVTIAATGGGGHCPGCVHGPDGNFICGAFNCGALVGTFDPDDSGASFLIGSGTTVVVSGSGTLYVRSHDAHDDGEAVAYEDNYGSYDVTATNCEPGV
jgi:hypothetical protein